MASTYKNIILKHVTSKKTIERPLFERMGECRFALFVCVHNSLFRVTPNIYGIETPNLTDWSVMMSRCVPCFCWRLRSIKKKGYGPWLSDSRQFWACVSCYCQSIWPTVEKLYSNDNQDIKVFTWGLIVSARVKHKKSKLSKCRCSAFIYKMYQY